MSIAEILLLDLDPEISNTRRTLERIPADKPDWVPHTKSMPLGKLAMHCATMPLFGYRILTDDSMDLAAPKHPHAPLVFTTTEAMLGQFDSSSAQLRTALASTTDAQLLANWPFSFGERVISNTSRALSYRMMFLNHIVHHTAQLGVYLRLNDIPVPGLYGPSADEQLSPK